MRPPETLKSLGIDVPKPNWMSGEEPHPLSGGVINEQGHRGPSITGEEISEPVRFQSIDCAEASQTKNRSMANPRMGRPPLKKTRHVRLVRLTEEDRILLMLTKSDSYSPHAQIRQVLIDVENPTEEEKEAAKEYGRHHAHTLA